MQTVLKDIDELFIYKKPGNEAIYEMIKPIYPKKFHEGSYRSNSKYCEDCMEAIHDAYGDPNLSVCRACKRCFCVHFPIFTEAPNRCLECIVNLQMGCINSPTPRYYPSKYHICGWLHKMSIAREEEVLSYKQEIENLKLEIAYRPGGTGANEAERSFNDLCSISSTNP